MSDPNDELIAFRRAAEELIPQLSERLNRHGLGEIEVRHGELRIRVAAQPSGLPAVTGRPVLPLATGQPASAAPTSRPEPAPRPAEPAGHGVTSPAVGFFVYAEGLGPGLAVEKGDALGHVEMLGVRHDVRAPRRGTVSHLVTEAGEPVEYGQLLVELDAAE